ncbi:RING finger and WD repeat domain-containing protein 3 [Binucleata daphniae]
MNDASYDCCPICFSEYTLDMIHRPTALKCGHIFGNQCIMNWCNKKSSLFCPTCFTKNRKNDIRILYGTSLRVYENNKQNETFEKFLDAKSQNEKLQQEILHLKTSIDYFLAEIKRLEEAQHKPQQEIIANNINECNNKSYDYVFKHKITAKNTNCIVLNEQHTNRMIYSARTIDSVGYKIIDLYSYEIKYTKAFEKTIEQAFVSDLRLSPYNDGLILISYSKSIKLINTITNNLLKEIIIENNVISMSFDDKDRTIIYFICNKGYLYCYDLINLVITKRTFVSKNLLSLGVFHDSIYINSVFEWFCIAKVDNKITKLEMPANHRCCNIFTSLNSALLTFKDKESKTLHFYCSKPKIDSKDNIHAFVQTNIDKQENTYNKLLSREIQLVKSRDKAHDNKTYVKNEIKNTIEVYCMIDLVNIKSYAVDEKIIDFDVSKTTLCIVTTSSILIYKKENKNTI